MITLSEGLLAYRVIAQAAGHSPRTINWIERSMDYFIELVGDRPDLGQITANDFRRFIIEYGQRPKFVNHPSVHPSHERVKPISVQTYARGVRAFFGHMAKEELIPKNPLARVKIPKVPVESVPTYTAEQVEQLLRVPDHNNPTEFRDAAFMLTILDSMARVSELCNLDDDDVDIKGGFLRLMGKGAKERIVPIGSKTCRLLYKYKLKYRPQPVGTEAFWLTQEGARLTPNRIGFLIRRYARRAGLGRCYPHKLRHTAAVLYLRNGGNVLSLQKTLGHTSLQMTRHYANLADADIKAHHNKFGVGDRLKIRI